VVDQTSRGKISRHCPILPVPICNRLINKVWSGSDATYGPTITLRFTTR
jgi:hypothetical protein